MTTRTPTRRAIDVPDLVGVRAEQAIQILRELGLMSITWAAAIEDASAAGYVLGLDPPAGSIVRLKACIAVSVAVHPDRQGHADGSLAGEAVKPAHQTSAGPEFCDHLAISPAELRGASVQPPEEHGLPGEQS